MKLPSLRPKDAICYFFYIHRRADAEICARRMPSVIFFFRREAAEICARRLLFFLSVVPKSEYSSAPEGCYFIFERGAQVCSFPFFTDQLYNTLQPPQPLCSAPRHPPAILQYPHIPVRVIHYPRQQHQPTTPTTPRDQREMITRVDI